MRLFIIVALVLTGCGTPPVTVTPQDVTTETWYRQDLEQLIAMNVKALSSFHDGKADDAAALIQQGEPLASKLLGVARPTLAAMQAASDLDDLYGRMLLSNRHYEWAQFQFQKNRARWKYWKPETPDTAHRLEVAEAAIAECERGMSGASGGIGHGRNTKPKKR